MVPPPAAVRPRRVVGVVLAGGAGRRMGGALPKPLVPLLGRPLVDHVVEPLGAVADEVVVVAGPHPAWAEWAGPGGGRPARVVVQERPTGNGDALRLALGATTDPADATDPADPAGPPVDVVVTVADAPLLRPATVAAVLAAARQGGLALLTADRPGDGAYGPVVRDAAGDVVAVDEPTTGPAPEVNASVYAAAAGTLATLVATLPPGRDGHECRVTDLVPAARRLGVPVRAVRCADPDEALGANTPAELARVGAVLAARVSRAR